MNLPDYSEYLRRPGMLNYIEKEWQKSNIHEIQAKVINEYLHDKTVLEIGCGTGNLAKYLVCKSYLGIDKNESCIELAKAKNHDKTFKASDIREIRKTKNQTGDVVIAMAIMKHFGLHEWDEIMKKLISLSNEMVIFDMPIHEYTYDDGEIHGHHHVWMSTEDIMNRLEYLGLEIFETDATNPIEPIFICLKK